MQEGKGRFPGKLNTARWPGERSCLLRKSYSGAIRNSGRWGCRGFSEGWPHPVHHEHHPTLPPLLAQSRSPHTPWAPALTQFKLHGVMVITWIITKHQFRTKRQAQTTGRGPHTLCKDKGLLPVPLCCPGSAFPAALAAIPSISDNASLLFSGSGSIWTNKFARK